MNSLFLFLKANAFACGIFLEAKEFASCREEANALAYSGLEANAFAFSRPH